MLEVFSGKKGKVVVFSPHPDDAEAGCSGLLMSLIDHGWGADFVVMTDGSLGGDRDVRRAEQSRACVVMGVVPTYLDLTDGSLSDSAAAISVVEGLILQSSPDLVLAPWHDDSHQDHRAASEVVVSAARDSHSILYYEMATSRNFNPTAFADISDQFERKMQALKCHVSQSEKRRSIETCARAMADYRGWQGRLAKAEGYAVERLQL